MKIDRTPQNREFTQVYHAKDFHSILREVNGAKKYDEYRALWEKSSTLECVPSYPLQLDFELNYSCNFSCPMCTWSIESSKGKGQKAWLDFEVFKKVIEEGFKKGLKAIRFNYVNEPLIRKDIAQFISYAKNIGIIDTYFSTNGSLLTEEMSLSLIESGLDRIQVSLDAFSQETFDKIRRGGNLKKILRNINMFKNIRKSKNSITPLLRVNFVKTKTNIHELNAFLEYWQDRADGIGVQNLVGIMAQSKLNEFENEPNLIRFNCAQPFYHMTIRYDGSILPCCAFFGAETPVARLKTKHMESLSNVGNLAFKEQQQLRILTIEEAWQGQEMQLFREIHKNGEYWKHHVCKRCVLSSAHLDETITPTAYPLTKKP